MNNPFKFGSVVDDPFFTNRTEELAKVQAIINSDNHLIMISPRRFGKTSLIRKAVKNSHRNLLFLDWINWTKLTPWNGNKFVLIPRYFMFTFHDSPADVAPL